MKTIFRLVQIAAVISLAACQTTTESQAPMAATQAKPAYPSPEEQRSAIFDCQKKMGIGGTSAMETKVLRSAEYGRYYVVTIVAGDKVTEAAATKINACAAKKLGLEA